MPPPRIEELLYVREHSVKSAAWRIFKTLPIHNTLMNDYQSLVVRNGSHVSRYMAKVVGQLPPANVPLFIALHGGGGVPTHVNDQQWQQMMHYYIDKPEIGGYMYVALRAPNDTWNGFYDDYVYPLIRNLIRQFVLFANVDPNQVFLLGVSHGGYGAFTIGSKMPDIFAAVHAAAAAPTKGETSVKNLRHLHFTYMIGERDHAHERYERCCRHAEHIAQLRGQRTDIYPAKMIVVRNGGHVGMPDCHAIAWMSGGLRVSCPTEVSWELTDVVNIRLYWLSTRSPSKGQQVDAFLDPESNGVFISTHQVSSLSVFFDSRMVHMNEPVMLVVNDEVREVRLKPSLRVLLAHLWETCDPYLSYVCEVKVI